MPWTWNRKLNSYLYCILRFLHFHFSARSCPIKPRIAEFDLPKLFLLGDSSLPCSFGWRICGFSYKDSNIRMLTGTIKADWIQLPVERYLTALPTLRQGVIAGVFKIKGAAPWAITRAEKLQLSVFLPNALSLDDWYAGVYALPTGLMCLCWEPAICAEWSAMTFTTYGRSMMSQACGAISTHNGDFCSSIWKPKVRKHKTQNKFR